MAIVTPSIVRSVALPNARKDDRVPPQGTPACGWTLLMVRTRIDGTEHYHLVVIIPAYNAEATLGEQLAALCRQTCDVSWQILVVDNGSIDATQEVALAYSSSRVPVSVVRAAAGSGPAYARNAGVSATSSPWIAFCDADDVVSAGWLSAISQALYEHDFVSGGVELEQLNSGWSQASRGLSFSNQLTVFEGMFPYASSCNMAVKREAFELVGGFDESMRVGEDIDLSLRLWQEGIQLHFEVGATVHYRLRNELRTMFRQSREYGAIHPVLIERCRNAGLTAPSRLAGVKSWLWMLRNLPMVGASAGRARWLWVAGRQIGRLQGGLRVRRLYI